MKKINSWFNDFFGTELKPYQSAIIIALYAVGLLLVISYLYLNQTPK